MPLEELGAMPAELVPRTLRVTGTPGLSLAAARRAEHVLARGYRLADVASSLPMTPAGISRVGSI